MAFPPLAAGLAAVTLAMAGTVAAAAVPNGRLLASNCFQCHGTNGGGPGFETLAGESAQSLYQELKEMQAGEEGSGLMVRHALGYTDAQLRALADYLARQRRR
jgi:sulfide dehydrogenase cytochrome subunit